MSLSDGNTVNIAYNIIFASNSAQIKGTWVFSIQPSYLITSHPLWPEMLVKL